MRSDEAEAFVPVGRRHRTPRQSRGVLCFKIGLRLELVPEKLIVYLVMVLNFGRLYIRAKQARAAIGRCLFQVSVPSLDVLTENLLRPRSGPEVLERRVDV